MEAVLDSQIEQLVLQTLRSSREGLDAFGDHLIAAAAAFEQGDDAAGLARLETVFPPLQHFTTFCASLISLAAVRAPRHAERLGAVAGRLETSFTAMCAQLTDKDYAAVADTARYDLVEVLDEFGIVFAEMLPVLEAQIDTSEVLDVN